MYSLANCRGAGDEGHRVSPVSSKETLLLYGTPLEEKNSSSHTLPQPVDTDARFRRQKRRRKGVENCAYELVRENLDKILPVY